MHGNIDRKATPGPQCGKQLKKSQGAPSLQDLAKLLGLAGPSSVEHHVAALQKKDFLEIVRNGRGKTRRYTLTAHGEAALRRTPVVGSIPAGEPRISYGDLEEDPVEKLGRDPDTYWLRVRGESMRDAGIFDGDYVLLRKVDVAANRAIAAVLIKGEEVTLKRVVVEEKHIRLIPENPGFSEQVFSRDEVEIQGVLRAVVRHVR